MPERSKTVKNDIFRPATTGEQAKTASERSERLTVVTVTRSDDQTPTPNTPSVEEFNI